MRLPITLAPVRSNVARAMSLSGPSSPPAPSLRLSRKNRCGKIHSCSSVHCASARQQGVAEVGLEQNAGVEQDCVHDVFYSPSPSTGSLSNGTSGRS
jgi:hypothetical protein